MTHPIPDLMPCIDEKALEQVQNMFPQLSKTIVSAIIYNYLEATRPAMTEDEREKVVIEMCDAYDWKSPDEDDPADFNAMSAALAVIERRKGA